MPIYKKPRYWERVEVIIIFSDLPMFLQAVPAIDTDSLNAKKILGNKRMPPRSKTYSLLRKNFLDIIDLKKLDVTIKKLLHIQE